jgi:hypothetical protein
MSSQIQGLKDAVECGKNAMKTTSVVPNATIEKKIKEKKIKEKKRSFLS